MKLSQLVREYGPILVGRLAEQAKERQPDAVNLYAEFGGDMTAAVADGLEKIERDRQNSGKTEFVATLAGNWLMRGEELSIERAREAVRVAKFVADEAERVCK